MSPRSGITVKWHFTGPPPSTISTAVRAASRYFRVPVIRDQLSPVITARCAAADKVRRQRLGQCRAVTCLVSYRCCFALNRTRRLQAGTPAAAVAGRQDSAPEAREDWRLSSRRPTIWWASRTSASWPPDCCSAPSNGREIFLSFPTYRSLTRYVYRMAYHCVGIYTVHVYIYAGGCYLMWLLYYILYRARNIPMLLAFQGSRCFARSGLPYCESGPTIGGGSWKMAAWRVLIATVDKAFASFIPGYRLMCCTENSQYIIPTEPCISIMQ